MSLVFEINIKQKTPDGWPVVVEQEEQGQILATTQEGILQLDTVSLKSQIKPADYGTVLGMALFRDQIRDAFVRALAKSEDRLHIALFVEDKELKTLHWEWLCAPFGTGWSLLALKQETPCFFYLPSSSERVFPSIEREDLRMLIVVASPEDSDKYGLPPFDGQTSAHSIQAALGEIPFSTLAATPEATALPTLDHICEQLTSETYTMLHIVAHGRYSRRKSETALYLSDLDNQVDVISTSELLERLETIRNLPYLVFLSTCESASPEAEGTLGGLAQRLVRRLGIPAVIAMTEQISIETAQVLSEKFYLRLQEHGLVDLALTEACAGLVDDHDVTVPVLYSRLRGRPLFGTSVQLTKRESEMANRLKKLADMVEQSRVEIEKSRIERDRLARNLAKTQHEAELARIDRAWEQERQSYMITTGGKDNGRLVVPSATHAMGPVAVGFLFFLISLIFSAAASSFGSGFSSSYSSPGLPPFACFGGAFFIFGVLAGIYILYKANKYQRAETAYMQLRNSLNTEDFYNQIIEQDDPAETGSYGEA
jgi:hypothetical protein